MNKYIIQRLKEWRVKKAREENIELYFVLQNKTIEKIAEKLPANEEEFKAIKGLGGKKYEKYGQDIISIVKECTRMELESDNSLDEKKVYSVGSFLNLINSRLSDISASVKGEISSVDIRERYLFFTIKDAKDDSCMDCFMWTRDYKLSGIELEEGLEIIIHGMPEIYKRSGRFSFRVEALELVGEGILKKKYEALKKKLASEGLFKVERKKALPIYPQKIGLITSRDGQVIYDFQNNIGKYGYKITFVDSRVEGPLAVKELISSIKYFKDKPIDILVIIRGGGSLESLQAFNNESLIREIINFPVPIICGIGHDKDVPLFSLVADRAVSTPTAVAEEINKTWDQVVEKIGYYESNIFNKYRISLSDYKNIIDQTLSQTRHYYQKMLKVFESFEQLMERVTSSYNYILRSKKEKIDNYLQILEQNNPERQLKLGYNIMFFGGKVIKSINQVKRDDIIESRMSDGTITSKIKQTKNGG